MNNEQKNTKALSICLQIQFCLVIFTAWAYDQNCLQKIEIHSSEIPDDLGTLSVLSASQKTCQLCNIQVEAGIDQVIEKSIRYECFGTMLQRVRSDPPRLINSA